MGNVGWIIIGIWCGYLMGDRLAHETVAEECRRLGGFFVEKAVFKCQEIIEPHAHTVPQALAPHGQ